MASHQIPISKICPREGWVEQDPMEIMNAVRETLDKTVSQLKKNGVDIRRLKAIGVTNQRETTVPWDSKTGKPLHNAIGKLIFCQNV